MFQVYKVVKEAKKAALRWPIS